jgi:hypothetical protein
MGEYNVFVNEVSNIRFSNTYCKQFTFRIFLKCDICHFPAPCACNVNVNLLWIKISRPKCTHTAAANAHNFRPLCLVFHSVFYISSNRVGSGPDSVEFLFLNLENRKQNMEHCLGIDIINKVF